MCLIVGNWKLNGSKNMIINLLGVLVEKFCDIVRCNIVIAPPVMYLDVARNCLMNSCIKLCAQNVDINLSGAHTGDISVAMLKDLDTKYVIIGHSERRMNHKESNVCIARKFCVVKKMDLVPILCIGETKEEYNAGYTHVICMQQIDEIIKLLGVQAFKNSVIAYEPIWAIGSGVSAVPENVQKVHKFIRNYISKFDKFVAKKILIQYGGSVTSDNIRQFLCQSDIDGVLVGSASLNVDSFVNIVKIAEEYER